MSSFKISGGHELKGTISVGGAKNAALKLLPAAILASGESVISNVPQILDIEKMVEILVSIGASVEFSDNTVRINADKVNSAHPDEQLVKKLRGSIVLIGALLSRFGKAVFSQPGGCLIGARPIDDHLDLFEQLGVNISYKNEKYFFHGKPKAADVVLKAMSVTATENAILASVFSKGTTRIHVAAAEPEIADLANYLNKMGAKISGAGTHDIVIEGVNSLKGAEYSVLPDRIEAGTYLIAAVATNSEITIGPVIPEHLSLVLKKLTDVGANFKIITRDGQNYIQNHKHKELTAQNIDTRPYPDLQSPYAVLMTQSKGESQIFETIFEGRFRYLEELRLMRAKVEILNPRTFVIHGPSKLVGSVISSKDIRGAAALVIAGLVANHETIIEDIDFIDRGYEKIDEKLQGLGAKIERIS
ncbi:MAG: UDP-N-acetylglucosamine 1-carboxyvinyltransferase [Candidatus Berkelbacteria bacterium]|nr:UDP-N-acetylglucosamine 1-carboxyvinyltransferase [Candidatus Berkelbacteria bacterium]